METRGSEKTREQPKCGEKGVGPVRTEEGCRRSDWAGPGTQEQRPGLGSCRVARLALFPSRMIGGLEDQPAEVLVLGLKLSEEGRAGTPLGCHSHT